jgi:[1-hydroxy-2-(trimethylamino)ethyl]phosphonate dioxygenase
MDTIDRLFAIYETRGVARYGGEQVSPLEHALQAAHLAMEEGAAPILVSAALLHDVGHLLSPAELDAGPPDDAQHERVGARFLAHQLLPDVGELVGLHVLAKRYLCAVEPGYMKGLTLASLRSLLRQGGPLLRAEARAFEHNPRHREAVRLRRWDDRAKVPGLRTPGLGAYRGVLADVLMATPSRAGTSAIG